MDTSTPRTRDLDLDALCFWAVVSGTWTIEHVREVRSNTHGANLMRSEVRFAMRHVLETLANNGVLSTSTPDPGFDAKTRCGSCGTVHRHDFCPRERWGPMPTPRPARRRRR